MNTKDSEHVGSYRLSDDDLKVAHRYGLPEENAADNEPQVRYGIQVARMSYAHPHRISDRN